MNWKPIRLIAALACSASVFGQVAQRSGVVPLEQLDPFDSDADTAVELHWEPIGRDQISTVWEATEFITNGVTGTVSTRPHRYTEIGSGLNYFDDTVNGYVPSEDVIELAADGGAAAVRGPAKLFLHANLNSAEAITILTSEARRFTTRPLGIFWYNTKSGASQLIASVRDCVGELLPPNQVVWRGAFGPVADLRITYTKSAIESDLILLQQPALPAGWDPSTARLELWHEWSVPSQPAIAPRFLGTDTDASAATSDDDRSVADEILDFGDLWFPTARPS